MKAKGTPQPRQKGSESKDSASSQDGLGASAGSPSRLEGYQAAMIAANKKGQTLAEWCFDHLDAASGYESTERQENDQRQATASK